MSSQGLAPFRSTPGATDPAFSNPNRYQQELGYLQQGVNVQIMPSRCLTGDAYAAANCGSTPAPFEHCAHFVADIDSVVTSYAIWASGPSDRGNLVPLIRAMRAP